MIGTSAAPAVALRRPVLASTRWCSTSAALRLLVDTVGADRVMVGSDYPYPLGERPAGGRGPQRPRFLDDDGAATTILSGNAAAFLGASACPA